MLKYLAFCGVAFAAFAIGTVGFAQIIGSLRTVRFRGIGMTLFTSILWLAILGGGAALVLCLIPQHQIALYIGYGISLVIMLLQKKIE